jgi:putative endopeptidase
MKPPFFSHKRYTRRKKKHPPLLQPPPVSPQEVQSSATISPGNSFYDHINKSWISSVSIPDYENDFGVSEEVEHSINEKIYGILHEAMEKGEKGDEYEKILGICGHSILQARFQKYSVELLRKLISSYGCMRDAKDIMRAMADAIRNGIPTLLHVRITLDLEEKDVYRVCLEPDMSGLHYTYYSPNQPGNLRILQAYEKLLKRLGAEFSIENLHAVIPFESFLVPNYLRADNEDLLPVRGEELLKKYPDIPWEEFMEALEIKSWKTSVFYIRSWMWFRVLQRLLASLTMEEWQRYFQKSAIFMALPYLPPPFDDIEYEFFGHRLQGQTQKLPQRELAIQILQDFCSPILSYVYAEKYVSKELVDQSRELGKELIQAAKRRLNACDWLLPATRKLAVEKVEKMKLGIAVPSRWRPLFIDSTKLMRENLLHNLFTLNECEYKDMISDVGKHALYWDEGVFRVNAYYYSESNELIIPAGTIVPPFFSVRAKEGWNYGGLGAIIGHEITHAFDMDGKDYDEKGRKKVWWQAKDRRMFGKKTKVLIKEFSNQMLKGHSVNGVFTLSENIADLGGLAIALDALKAKHRGASEQEMNEILRAFFISYAVSWRTKIRDKKLIQMLLVDRHAPPVFRVNLVVRQFDEWYAAFGITEKDAMWIPPEHRIRIF